MATPTYVALANVTLGSSTGTVTFASIPSSYRDLVIVADVLGLSGNPASTGAKITLNGTDGTSVYMYGVGSGSGTSATSAVIEFPVGDYRNFGVIQIMDYSATDKHKTVLQRIGSTSNAVWAVASRWASTSAVTSVTINGADGGTKTFDAGCIFALYGIEA